MKLELISYLFSFNLKIPSYIKVLCLCEDNVYVRDYKEMGGKSKQVVDTHNKFKQLKLLLVPKFTKKIESMCVIE